MCLHSCSRWDLVLQQGLWSELDDDQDQSYSNNAPHENFSHALRDGDYYWHRVRSIRVSNELGAGRPQAARLATRVVILLAISLGVCEGLVMVLARNLLGYAYSNEDEVASYTAKLTPILAVCTLFDSLQCVLSGM